MPPIDDAEVAIRAALTRGDVREAIRLLLATYGPELRAYLLANVRDRERAKELESELGEQLLSSLPRFRGDSSVRTYVYAIAWNVVRHDRRRARRARDAEPISEGDPRFVAPGERTRTPAFRRTTARLRLEAARASLAPDELNLLVLRVDRQMPWSEIGAILGTGTSAAATAVLRKRFERLVQRLRRSVLEPDDGG